MTIITLKVKESNWNGFHTELGSDWTVETEGEFVIFNSPLDFTEEEAIDDILMTAIEFEDKYLFVLRNGFWYSLGDSADKPRDKNLKFVKQKGENPRMRVTEEEKTNIELLRNNKGFIVVFSDSANAERCDEETEREIKLSFLKDCDAWFCLSQNQKERSSFQQISPKSAVMVCKPSYALKLANRFSFLSKMEIK